MEESQIVDLSFSEGATETLYVSQITPNCFRLRETPIMGPDEEEVYLGDVIQVELHSDGTYYFVRVVERTPMQHYSWVVPEFFVESPQYGEYGAAVKAAGGAWWESLMDCWLRLQSSMRDTVERGTAKSIAKALEDTGWQIGGKTGSGTALLPKGAQIDGWFAGLIIDPQGNARIHSCHVRQERRVWRGKRRKDFGGISPLHYKRETTVSR